MATTPNYGWVTPAPTDLVTDLPADFETFADAVDADLAGLLGGTTGQVLTKASGTDHDFAFATLTAGIPATIFDAKGDLIAATAADTAARLAIGTNNHVLTADSGEATGMKWAAVSAAADNFTLINAGGTALTGANTITVSGISGKNTLYVYVKGASCTSASGIIRFRLNADSTTDIYQTNLKEFQASYSAQDRSVDGFTQVLIAEIPEVAMTAYGSILISGCNAAGVKPFQLTGTSGTGANGKNYLGNGHYAGTSTISSVSILSSGGNFDAGTVFVYGA